MTRRLLWFAALTALVMVGAAGSAQQKPAGSYQELLALFAEWTAFERPPLLEGAPDYTAITIASRHDSLKVLQGRLEAIVPSAWPIDQQIDHALVRAQMNGLDFYIHVLQPWVRDPAFYQSIWTAQSDTPAHEGPTHHAVIELWTYTFPLSIGDESKLTGELRTIPPLLRQAQRNLTGNARDLWITGTGTMRNQIRDLGALAGRTAGPATRSRPPSPTPAQPRQGSCRGSIPRLRRRPDLLESARSSTPGACKTSTLCR